MKKTQTIGLILLAAVFLSGCSLIKDKSQSVIEEDVGTVSDDDSLVTIEKELDETEMTDFDKELDEMDKDINQL